MPGRRGKRAGRPDASAAVTGGMLCLPQVPDQSGRRHERPSWLPVALVGAGVATVNALGARVLSRGSALGVLAVGAASAAAVAFAAESVALAQVLGARKADNGGDDPVGAFLAGDGALQPAGMGPALDGPQLGNVAHNRALEAAATREWLSWQPPAERTEIEAEDGVRLVGHVIEANPGSERWFVFAHGYSGSWKEGLAFARRFAAQGFNVLLTQMRAHGESGGNEVGFGWLDRRDLVGWCRWVIGRAGEGARIVLMGHSMGGASVLMAAGEDDLPSQVRAVVSDSAYSDVWNVGLSLVRDGNHMPPHPMLDGARLALLLRRGGYDVAKASPEAALAHAHAPVLLIHGELDTFVPPYMARRLASCGTGHQLEIFPGAGHCQSVFADPMRYERVISEFVGRFL